MARRRSKTPAQIPYLRAWLEGLEDRTAPAITVDILGQPANSWVFNGPAGFDGGLATSGTSLNGASPTGDRIAGAINSIAVSRQNPNIAYAASVNGGIYKTANLL